MAASRESYELSEKPYYEDLLGINDGLDEEGYYPGQKEYEASDTD